MRVKSAPASTSARAPRAARGRTFVPRIGCAGWSLGRATAQRFPETGTHLQRYSGLFNCVEINSSFYRPHRPATYERWAASVPDDFRFSVKCPKTISHDLRLAGAGSYLDDFLAQVAGLGGKLGCLLLQLPPGFRFARPVVQRFFALLRKRHAGHVVCEPRHASWFTEEGSDTLARYRIARVVADPPIVADTAFPASVSDVSYWRLHGSPRMYHSAYGEAFLRTISAAMHDAGPTRSTWCILDNTASGAAVPDALLLQTLLREDADANCRDPSNTKQSARVANARDRATAR